MTKKSRAAVFTAAGRPLELRSFPLPDLAPGELLVRVSCSTLCRSDAHTYQGHRTTPAPTILGHEILGHVEALGPGDPAPDAEGRPLRVGDRVTWSIMASCDDCFFCHRSIPQKCERLFKYGHQEIDESHPLSGGLAEHCHLAVGTTVLRVPDGLSDEVATPANCATATVAAALRSGGGARGQTVLIQGAGMLGLSACAMANAQGSTRIIVCDVDSDRLEWARRFGATDVVQVTGDAEATTRAVLDLTEGRGADLAIELSGAASAMEEGLGLLRIGGCYILVGAVFTIRPIAIDPERIVRRLLNIRGVHNYTPVDLVEAIRFLERHHMKYPFHELVTGRFDLQDAEAAFRHAIETRALRVAVCP